MFHTFITTDLGWRSGLYDDDDEDDFDVDDYDVDDYDDGLVNDTVYF